jgi:hypothetical protein
MPGVSPPVTFSSAIAAVHVPAAMSVQQLKIATSDYQAEDGRAAGQIFRGQRRPKSFVQIRRQDLNESRPYRRVSSVRTPAVSPAVCSAPVLQLPASVRSAASSLCATLPAGLYRPVSSELSFFLHPPSLGLSRGHYHFATTVRAAGLTPFGWAWYLFRFPSRHFPASPSRT